MECGQQGQGQPALSRMVKGSTIGIVGFGGIGRAFADRLRPFGARVLTTNRGLVQTADNCGVEPQTLDSLLRESDVIVVTVAINDSSRKLIDREALAKLKPEAYLINISRGDAVDEAALVDALRAKQIAGAALNTFEIEPLAADSPLRSMDNVIPTRTWLGTRAKSMAQ